MVITSDELCLFVNTHEPDIINATETHLNSTISSSELGLQDYEIFRNDRPDHEMPGGGLLIGIKKNIIASEMTVHNNDLAALWCKIQIMGCKPLINSCFYRKPTNDPDPIIKLDDGIQNLTSTSTLPNVLLTGDFNLPHRINWGHPGV